MLVDNGHIDQLMTMGFTEEEARVLLRLSQHPGGLMLEEFCWDVCGHMALEEIQRVVERFVGYGSIERQGERYVMSAKLARRLNVIGAAEKVQVMKPLLKLVKESLQAGHMTAEAVHRHLEDKYPLHMIEQALAELVASRQVFRKDGVFTFDFPPLERRPRGR